MRKSILTLMASLLMAGVATASPYYSVTDLGSRDQSLFPYDPKIDDQGRIVDFRPEPGGNYVLERLPYSVPGQILFNTLHTTDDARNRLPDSFQGRYTLVKDKNIHGNVLIYDERDPRGSSYFFSPSDNRLIQLKSLAHATGHKALAMDDLDRIVGNVGNQAALWETPGSDPIVLDSLAGTDSGWSFLRASGINNRGQIVGYGINPDGVGSGYLLTPVATPEPSTLSLCILAGAVFSLRLIKKKVSEDRV